MHYCHYVIKMGLNILYFSLAGKWCNMLFLCRLVDSLLSSMTENELSELESSELYRTSSVLNVALQGLAKNTVVEFKSIIMELHKIPEQQIGKFVCLNKLESCNSK